MTASVRVVFAVLIVGVALVAVGAETAANDRLLTDGKKPFAVRGASGLGKVCFRGVSGQGRPFAR